MIPVKHAQLFGVSGSSGDFVSSYILNSAPNYLAFPFHHV